MATQGSMDIAKRRLCRELMMYADVFVVFDPDF
jgi:hypothetical protein